MPEASSPGSELYQSSGKSRGGMDTGLLATLELARQEAQRREAVKVQPSETYSPEGGVGVSDSEASTKTSPESGAPKSDFVPASDPTSTKDSVASADQAAVEAMVPESQPEVGKNEIIVPEAVQAEMNVLLQGLTANEIGASINEIFFDSGLARSKAEKSKDGKNRGRFTVFKNDDDKTRYTAARICHKRALILEQKTAKKDKAQAERHRRPPKEPTLQTVDPLDEISDTANEDLGVGGTPEDSLVGAVEPTDTMEPTQPEPPPVLKSPTARNPSDHSDLRRAVGSYTSESAVQRTRNRYADRRDLVERFGELGDGRPEMSPHVYEQALAENPHMGFAAAQMKNNQIEAARQSIAQAHERGEAAASASLERTTQAKSSAESVSQAVQQAIVEGVDTAFVLPLTGDVSADAAARRELSELIGLGAEPSGVVRHKNDKDGFKYTDIVYAAAGSKNLAFIERFTTDGVLLGHMVVTTKEQAFKPKRFGRGVKISEEVGDWLSKPYSGSAPEALDFSDTKSTVRNYRRQKLTENLGPYAGKAARSLLGRLGTEAASPQATPSERRSRSLDPVRQRLEAAGYDAVTADAVARRRKRRSGIWNRGGEKPEA